MGTIELHLAEHVVGRILLKLTKFWLNSAIKRISSTTELVADSEFKGCAYPNLHIKLTISSKAALTLCIEQLEADVYFGGLFAGTIIYTGNSDDTIQAKGKKDINLQFVPPLQIYLLKHLKCDLLKGIVKFHCFLGSGIIHFSICPKETENVEQANKVIKELLLKIHQ